MFEVAIIYGTRKADLQKEHTFFWLFSIQAFILFAFRDLLFLSDTLGYYYHFNDVKQTPLFKFDIYERFGIGYLIYEKFIHNYISDNFLVFNVITTAITMIPVLKYFRKNSECIWFTFLLFMATRLIFSEAIALRQGLALGVCMMGSKYLTSERKQLYKFLPYVLIASSLHGTAIMYLLIFFIYYFNSGNNRKILILMLVGFTVFFAAFDSILNSYYSGIEDSVYLRSASETGYFNMVGIYTSIIALVICIYIYRMRKLCYVDGYENLYVITIFFVFVSFLSIKLFVITRYLIYLYPFVIIYLTKLYTQGKKIGRGTMLSKIFLVIMNVNYLYIIYTRPEWVFFSDFKFWTNDISSYPNI